jgi:hypothetical protein
MASPTDRLEGWLRRAFDTRAGSDWRHFKFGSAVPEDLSRGGASGTPVKALWIEYSKGSGPDKLVGVALPADLTLITDTAVQALLAQGSTGEPLAQSKPGKESGALKLSQLTLSWEDRKQNRRVSATVIERAPRLVGLVRWFWSHGVHVDLPPPAASQSSSPLSSTSSAAATVSSTTSPAAQAPGDRDLSVSPTVPALNPYAAASLHASAAVSPPPPAPSSKERAHAAYTPAKEAPPHVPPTPPPPAAAAATPVGAEANTLQVCGALGHSHTRCLCCCAILRMCPSL